MTDKQAEAKCWSRRSEHDGLIYDTRFLRTDMYPIEVRRGTLDNYEDKGYSVDDLMAVAEAAVERAEYWERWNNINQDTVDVLAEYTYLWKGWIKVDEAFDAAVAKLRGEG